MAEAKKSAPTPEPAEAAPKAKKNTLLYIVIAVLVLVILAGGGVATYLILSLSNAQNYSDQAAAEESDKGSDAKEQKKKKKEKKSSEKGGIPHFFKLGVYTVNLQGGSSVLQCEIWLQDSDEKQDENIKAFIPLLSNQVNLLLAAKKPEELSTTADKVKLMGELKAAFNQILNAKEDEDGVMNVTFQTFIIQ